MCVISSNHWIYKEWIFATYCEAAFFTVSCFFGTFFLTANVLSFVWVTFFITFRHLTVIMYTNETKNMLHLLIWEEVCISVSSYVIFPCGKSQIPLLSPFTSVPGFSYQLFKWCSKSFSLLSLSSTSLPLSLSK